jgi:hypothetical protein
LVLIVQVFYIVLKVFKGHSWRDEGFFFFWLKVRGMKLERGLWVKLGRREFFYFYFFEVIYIYKIKLKNLGERRHFGHC